MRSDARCDARQVRIAGSVNEVVGWKEAVHIQKEINPRGDRSTHIKHAPVKEAPL